MGKRKKSPTTFPAGSVEEVTLSPEERATIARMIDGESPSPGVRLPPHVADAGGWSKVEAEARQSELRFERIAAPKDAETVEQIGKLTEEASALDAFLSEDERTAPYAAVLTPEQLGAILDDKASDDGVEYEEPATWLNVAIHEPWLGRLMTLASEQAMSVEQYVEGMIRRQWVARPLAGKVKR